MNSGVIAIFAFNLCICFGKKNRQIAPLAALFHCSCHFSESFPVDFAGYRYNGDPIECCVYIVIFVGCFFGEFVCGLVIFNASKSGCQANYELPVDDSNVETCRRIVIICESEWVSG